MISKVFFFFGLLCAASGLASPPVALAMGLAFGLVFTHPFPRESARFSKFLLQASVVGLGFGMKLQAVLHAGRSGFLYTLLSIAVAAATYGSAALQVGSIVYLPLALWIVPLDLGTAVIRHTKARIQWPWFIAYFCLAAVCNTYLPAAALLYAFLSKVAKIGLTVTLYLIGTGLSIATLKRVGHRPLIQGVLLWLVVALGSLWLIYLGWIAL